MRAARRAPRRVAWIVSALGMALLAGCGTAGTVQGGNDAFSATTRESRPISQMFRVAATGW